MHGCEGMLEYTTASPGYIARNASTSLLPEVSMQRPHVPYADHQYGHSTLQWQVYNPCDHSILQCFSSDSRSTGHHIYRGCL